MAHPGRHWLYLVPAALLGCGDSATSLPEPFSGSVTQNAWCSLVPSPCFVGAGAAAIQLAIPNANPAVGGDGTLILTISGDLDDNVLETFHVEVENIDLGILFNGDPGDDLFDLAVDTPTDCVSVTTRATLAAAALTLAAADGILEVTLTPDQTSSGIDEPGCPAEDELLTATIEYPISG